MSIKIRLDNMISYPLTNYSLKLSSDEARGSSSWVMVQDYYARANQYFRLIQESFRCYRGDNGDAYRAHWDDLKPINSRLQFELVALVSEIIMNSLPNLENIIDNDSNINEADKIVCKLAYQNLQSQIQSLRNMYGQACFGFKKDEEQVEK